MSLRLKPAVVQIVGFGPDGSIVKTGTGFFIGSDGVLLTNFHVVSDTQSVVACTNTGAVYFLERVILHPPDVDAVMLKFAATDVPFLKLSSAAELVEGQKVLVIGNPEGLQGTVSDGIVSAFGENRAYIQITAPIAEQQPHTHAETPSSPNRALTPPPRTTSSQAGARSISQKWPRSGRVGIYSESFR